MLQRLHYHKDFLFYLAIFLLQIYLVFYLYFCYQILVPYLCEISLFYLMDTLLIKLLLLLAQHFSFFLLNTLLFPYCVNLLLNKCSSNHFLLLHRLNHLHTLLRMLCHQSTYLLYFLLLCCYRCFSLPYIVLLCSFILELVFSLFYIFFFLMLLCFFLVVLL